MQYFYIEPFTDQQQKDILKAAENIGGNGARAVIACMMYAGLDQYEAIKVTPHRIIETGIGGAFPVIRHQKPYMLAIIPRKLYREAVRAWQETEDQPDRYIERFSEMTGEQAKETALKAIQTVRTVQDWTEAKHILNMTALEEWKQNPINDDYIKMYFKREYQEDIDHNIMKMPPFRYTGSAQRLE